MYDINKHEYINNLIYILKLSFNKYKILYIIYISNIFSVVIEFLAIGILSVISKEEFDIQVLFIQNLQKEELFIIFIFLFLIRFSSIFLLESMIVYYAKEMQVYLSITAFDKVVHENIKDIEKNEIGHYITLSGDEASNASQILISMTGIVNHTLLILSYLVSLLFFSNEVFLWLILLLLIIYFSVKFIYKIIFNLGHEQAVLRRKTGSMFIDAFNALRALKALSIESFMSDEYKIEVGKYFTINSKLVIYNNLTRYIPIIMLFVFFEAYLLYCYIANKSYDIAFFLTLLFILMRLLQAIGTFSGLLGKIIGELKGVHNIVKFIRDFPVNSKNIFLQEQVNEIKIDNVSFSYDENRIFERLNFSFITGQSYAVYGESGVGKSTLLDLIMDFISPNNGQVLINGINVKNIDESSLTKKVMYVGQDSFVFNKSIRDNIELNNNFNSNELMDALKIVKLEVMVDQLDEGLDYKLFYKGTNISGGQRQRISLARALIRNPDVLILDEVTSALDSETKDFIMTNIVEIYKDKILIFVTHDSLIFPFVDHVIDLQQIKDNQQKLKT